MWLIGYHSTIRLVNNLTIKWSDRLISVIRHQRPQKFSTQLTGIIVVVKLMFLKN
jgi:hypothetical protein